METGIKVVDHQHQEFLAMLETLMLEMMDKVDLNSFKAIRKYILFLNKYITSHFIVEESIMKEFGYPELPEHHQKHVFFIEKFQKFEADFTSNPITAEKLKAFHKFLQEWLNQHIRNYDLKMAEFIRKKSEKNPHISKRLNDIYKNYAEETRQSEKP